MFNPISTYRIQFHKGFTFSDFERIIPYLQQLGIKTIYASPIFAATPGSMHGYDIIDPLLINPEIGTIEQLTSISKELRDKNISWIQDIVPNHMAFNSGNLWLMDVLEKGEHSAYKTFFDQSLIDNLFNGPIMVPFLGSAMEEAIGNKELQLAFDNNKFSLHYTDQKWPVRFESYAVILNSIQNEIPAKAIELIKESAALASIEIGEELAAKLDSFKTALGNLYQNGLLKTHINNCVKLINADRKVLINIAESQHYRLCSYEETDQQINYRRFFTVNSLICINIHRDEVFDKYHGLIKKLLTDGIFQGLRVDHIDGLYDPPKYLNDLRKLAGNDTYIIAEKILEEGEELIPSWPIQGTTGYDFLSFANNLFTNGKAEKQFIDFYKKLTGINGSVPELIREKKEFILTRQMGGELDNLTRLLINSKLITKNQLDKISYDQLKNAIASILVFMPVYRYYGNKLPFGGKEKHDLQKIFEVLKKDNQENIAAIKLLGKVLSDDHRANKVQRKNLLHFYQRCMQFTGPVMAKGVEDTLMYSYNGFIDHNEVGDTPETFSIKTEEFHERMISRQKKWPLALNGTSTHDTKRGEDVRARLNVLADIPTEWFDIVNHWINLNRKHKKGNIPDANDEYLVYQTLIGAFPMPGNDEDNFPERLQDYLQKALREAKVHTNWAEQDEKYEEATQQFANKLLNRSSPFWKSFSRFHEKISALGVVNSLSQVVIKFMSPGVPDIYQGSDAWDLSLVDPDNRRAIDYKQRSNWLDKLNSANEVSIKKLWQNKFDGKIKVWLTNTLATLRKNDSLTFSKGKYLPLKVEGACKEHILAFARKYQDTWYIAVIPLNIGILCETQEKELSELDWSDTRVALPKNLPNNFESILTKEKGNLTTGLLIADVFKEIPFSILKFSKPTGTRGAGVLMHITSLLSPFGIGDFGPGAKKFADLLHKTRQKYWQILPLSPVEEANQYSPYSSWSAMGGNTMLISPQLLVDDGLLKEEDVERYLEPNNGKVDFKPAAWLKNILFESAWVNFSADDHSLMKAQFDVFCRQEEDWLNDFAVYEVLKATFYNQPWYDWSENYKARQKADLIKFEQENGDLIAKSKWLQFIFNRQWQQLKTYCNQLNVSIIGDLPFYISYDSADVWANRNIFNLDGNGNPLFIAGVPPDYFNADGQLWGMPVFNWEKLKEQKYEWWIRRVGKNIELFDLVRLDHFRAFSSYWSVPAAEKTAINGKWDKGPANDIFNAFKQKFGELPFIAEDLGDIDEKVYQLRDEFGLPGMKVIQFAFGDNLAVSPHIPHNYKENEIAYTGTHDNNTTRGWYLNDIEKSTRKQVKKHIRANSGKNNIHEQMIALIMASAAKTVIVPVQDLLGLDEHARMNTPAATNDNWLWRLTDKDWKNIPIKKLKHWIKTFNRI